MFTFWTDSCAHMPEESSASQRGRHEGIANRKDLYALCFSHPRFDNTAGSPEVYSQKKKKEHSRKLVKPTNAHIVNIYRVRIMVSGRVT